jgi:hypothetical protein
VATVNKDFKVKHGLDVNQGGTFGGTVTVATPTENTHATTKLYVDSKGAVAAPASTAPASPVDGQLCLIQCHAMYLFTLLVLLIGL